MNNTKINFSIFSTKYMRQEFFILYQKKKKEEDKESFRFL